MIETVESGAFKVYFASRWMLDRPIPENCVLIVPTGDTWNDFGHYSGIEIAVSHGSLGVIRFLGMIGFVKADSSSHNGAARLRELLKGADAPVPVEEEMFFTMLPEMEAYRSVVSELGVDAAQSMLLALRDLVATHEFARTSSWLFQALDSEIFALSFVRSSEAYFAFKNAGSLLRGLNLEALDVISSSIGIKFALDDGRSYALKFDFDHDADLPRRIAVIIGKNGVGKSQILRRIVKSALTGSRELRDGNDGRPLISRILAFAPTNEAAAVFPPHRGKRARVWYRRHSLNRSAGSRAEGGTSDLIIQVARSTSTIGGVSKWDIFLEAIPVIRHIGEVCLCLRNGAGFVALGEVMGLGEMEKLELFARVDLRRDPVRVVDGKGYALSSGELSFLKFAAQASLSVENGSLLLLDEPETHLHPNFVGSFVSLLNRLLSRTGSVAILATHSVYFVREVFREQVSVLSVDDEMGVQIQRPTLRTFGADVGAISYFVFGEDEASDLAAEVEQKILGSQRSWSEIYEAYKDELSLEFLSRLRAKIEAVDEEN